ncbi:hypothetical protein EON63_14930 [archaeon]|nr:MAG: hypothetical protein EON63_14930 [archaeon]
MYTIHHTLYTIHHTPYTLHPTPGKGIVNSNLVKCAIGGNDPNVGRIVGAIGSVLSKLSSSSEVHIDAQHGMCMCVCQ